MSNEPMDRRARIRPLQTSYKRPDNVLDSIAYYQSVPESVRFADADRMPGETGVYFIRNTALNCRALWDRLFGGVSKRAAKIIHESVRGLPEIDAADLSGRVHTRVMQMVVNPEPSRKCDLLECHFRRAVEGEALNALGVHLRSPLGALRGAPAASFDDDGDEMDRPLEELVSSGLGPEDQLLVLRDRNRRHQLLRIACRAVPDRRHLKAAVLRWGYDWPIHSIDPTQRSLTRQFGVSKPTMDRWLADAMNAMRAALANEPEMFQSQLAQILKGGR